MIARFVLLTVCFISAECFKHQEPASSCSRIDFEEKMLERMIVLDHRVKTVLDDVKSQMQTFSRSIATFKDEMTSLKSDVLETKELLKTDQDVFKEEMTRKYITMVAQAEEKLLHIETTVQNKTRELQDKVLQDPIAFTVRFSGHVALGSGKTFVFNTVVLNAGDAYDPTDGTFTAPVSGVYTLSAHVCVDVGYYLHYSIRSTSTVYGASRYGDQDIGDTCSSVSTVALLEQGEKVYVVCTGTNAAGGKHLETTPSYYWTMFSGAFLQPAA